MALSDLERSWSDGLNGATLAIAGSSESPIRVCAGPGTGKTTALMSRVWRLLEEGSDPSRIFVVTFTRAAARDLTDALRNLSAPGAEKVRASTLHSYCFSSLRKSSVFETTGRIPRPLMPFEERFLEEDLIKAGRGILDCRRFRKAFEASWARLQSDTPGWPNDSMERAFHQELMEWLKLHHSMLIGELTTEMLAYLRNNPLCEERSAFDHILFDEYQDLNRANQEMIDLLAHNSNLIVVGDEDQSIYSTLQYAQPEGIREFPATHPGTYDTPLDVCYRCPTKIVKIANNLISWNSDREQRDLEEFVKNGPGKIDIVQWNTMESEAEGIARLVRDYLEDTSCSPNDVMILAPRRDIGRLILDNLNGLGILAHGYFFDKALDSETAQERFTLLALLANPNDRVSLRCWLGFGWSERGRRPYAHLLQRCRQQGSGVKDALDELSQGDYRFTNSDRVVERYGELEQERDALADLKDAELVDALFPKGDPNLSDLRALSRLTREVSPNDLDAVRLLEDLRTRILFPEPPHANNYVRVMSLHKSKGLSAKYVVVSGCVEGWIPFLQDDDDYFGAERNLQEQRRLFYVAITRAKDTLILSSFQTMPTAMARSLMVKIAHQQGNRSHVHTSRFLRELGPAAPLPREG